MEDYIFNSSPLKYICGCLEWGMPRNVHAVFDRTNNTSKLEVVNMPFGVD